jgi:hypothetical protein
MTTTEVEAPAPELGHEGSQSLIAVAERATHEGTLAQLVPSGLPSAAFPIRILAALTWIFWSSRLFVEIGTFPTAAIWSILFGIGAIVLLGLYAVARSERVVAMLDTILICGTLIIGVIWVIALVYGNSNYGTDEAAFVQGAAQTLLHGHDPYGANLSWTLQRFAVQPNAYTYTTTGHLISQLDYPALAFLPEAALIAIGVSTQATIWVCAAFLALSGLVLMTVVPPRYRPFAALLLGFDAYFDAAASGLIFTEMLVFTVIAIISWQKYVDRSPGWRGWLSPVALGLAISIQQDSWFLVPCFLVAVYQEASLKQQRTWPTMARYAAILGLTFLAVNLPFIFVGPWTWVHGILEPLTLPLMPLGQGLIGLTTYLGIGGGDLSLYSITSLLVLAALLLTIGFHYRRTRLLVPLAPAIVLWFSTRSLSQYVLIAAFALLAAMCCWKNEVPTFATIEPCDAKSRKQKRVLSDKMGAFAGMRLTGALLIGGSVAAAGCSLGLALSSTAPLSIQIASYHSTGEEQTIDSLDVGVRNNTGDAKSPIFVVEDGPYVGTPWLSVGGNKVIPPHSYRMVKILAPNTVVMPSLNSALKVAAFTSGPTAVSTSASFLPNDDHTILTPFGFSGVVPIGETRTVTVQVLNRLGSPVTKSGIQVQLGQEIYSPAGLFATENSINGQGDGQSPVGARTNAQGVATFHIRADQAASAATTLQAWLGSSVPTGYSNRVIVWFGYSNTASNATNTSQIAAESGPRYAQMLFAPESPFALNIGQGYARGPGPPDAAPVWSRKRL